MIYDRVSFSCIRHMINTFLVLYRILHWAGTVPHETAEGCTTTGEAEQTGVRDLASKIHQYHLTAGKETFYKLSMYYDLPVAARLNYRHTFPGLYNCITQAVYFHNPDYERR